MQNYTFGERQWRRHANPLSGYTRVLISIALPFIIWFYAFNPYVMGAMIFLFATNPWWFPAPKRHSNDMMYHLVRGEYIWLKQSSLFMVLFIFVPKGVCGLYGFYLLANHHLWPGAAIITMVYLAKFIYCMHTIYLSRRDNKQYIFPKPE